MKSVGQAPTAGEQTKQNPRRTGSESGRTNETKPASDIFRHRSRTGKTYCRTSSDVWLERFNSDLKCLKYNIHRQFLSLLVEHRASMKSFQALRSPAIPLTSFHDLPVFLISSSIALRHVLFGLPLLYPRGFQSSAVFSIVPASLCILCPIQIHFLPFIRISIDKICH
jgi:hypothetical protein